MINSCIVFASNVFKIAPYIISSIIQIESGGNASAISKDKQDYGLMQIRHKYVPGVHKSSLLNGCFNILVGSQILSKAKSKCLHKEDYKYVTCYNRGVFGGSKLAENKVEKDNYYLKFKKTIAKHKKEWQNYKQIKSNNSVVFN